MACNSCMRKAAQRNMAFASRPVDCVYTQEQLETKLAAAISSNNKRQITYLQRSLNNYGRNCNRYIRYIT